MSKVVKGIKKGVKKVGKVIKKAAPYVLMAAAAYFTAGVALSYFGPTAGFAASMPGFGTAGIFTKAATFVGLSGPASAAASAAAGSAAATGAMAGLGPLSNAAYASATGVSSSSLAGLGGSVGAAGGWAGVGGSATGAAAGGAAAGNAVIQSGGKGMLKQTVQQGTKEAVKGGMFSGMNAADKLLMAKTVTDVASGLFADKPRDPNKYFWGRNRKGEGEGMGIIGNPRVLPEAGQRPSTDDLYGAGTPEFMPQTKEPPRTGADRQMDQYQQRNQRTDQGPVSNEEEFI